jgi:hypothetical protein
MSEQCYAEISCTKNIFNDNLDTFHDTWNNILNKTVKLPIDVDFIDINPGIIINGSTNTIDLSIIKSKILTHLYTKKLTVIATPVYFFEYGKNSNHLCSLYITIDKSFGSRKIPKISINYFNPHGSGGTRIKDEIDIINQLRIILLDGFSKLNPDNLLINIRTHMYNGLNLQNKDPMGMCIFYAFTVLSYFMQNKISNKNLSSLGYNTTINQLVDELLDSFLYEDTNNCKQLSLVANMINESIVNKRGGGTTKNDIFLKQIKKYIKYDASSTNLLSIAKFLKISDKIYLKKNINKKIKNISIDLLHKLHEFIFN